MTDRMLREGLPRLVLVNGSSAIQHFEATYKEILSWDTREYESEAKPGKNLWHMEGMLRLNSRQIPVAGFPFLRNARTHNATVEIEQLGRYGSALVGALPGGASGPS